jgi:hypothetical protein
MVTLEVSRTERIKARDWQFTEFVMRTWSEPELADRYSEDPVATLAAFGICIHSPQEAPELRAAGLDGIVIEDLDHAAPVSASYTLCG